MNQFQYYMLGRRVATVSIWQFREIRRTGGNPSWPGTGGNPWVRPGTGSNPSWPGTGSNLVGQGRVATLVGRGQQ